MKTAAVMTGARRLRGHTAAATCCAASSSRPGLVATGGEDGYVSWHDSRCNDMLFNMEVGNGNPVSSLKSRTSPKPKVGAKSTGKGLASATDSKSPNQSSRNLHLDYSMGGHVAAVSSVTFSMFGEKGRFIISGGNDKSVKVWDLSKFYSAGLANDGNDLLHTSIDLKRKVNWLCTTPSDSENLVICDTSKIVNVYTVG